MLALTHSTIEKILQLRPSQQRVIFLFRTSDENADLKPRNYFGII